MNAPGWSSEIQRELESLLSDLLDERLDNDGQCRLDELLQRHGEARRLYVEYCAQHNDLFWLGPSWETKAKDAAPSAAAGSAPMPGPIEPARASRRANWPAWALVVGALAASMLAAWLARRSVEPIAAPVAEIVREEGAAWNAIQRAAGSRSRLLAGPLALDQGQAELKMSDVRLTLLGPANVLLIDDHTVRVVHGRLRAEVGPAAIGFRVLTSAIEVVDLGTEFGVDATGDGTSEVHVFKGVVVASAVGQRQIVPIYENEAGLAADGGSITGIDVDPARFALSPAKASAKAAAPKRSSPYAPLDSSARIVVVGDETIDQETPLLLVAEAFREANRPAPKLINGSMAGDYLKHLENRVFSFQPTHVVIALRSRYLWVRETDEAKERDYVRQIGRLAETIQSRGIEVLLMTGYVPDRARREHAPEVAMRHSAGVRALAEERGYRLGDLEKRWLASAANDPLLDRESRYPNFAGYRLFAETLLDLFGYPDLEVPDRLTLALAPGVAPRWEYRFVPALTASIVDEPITNPDVVGGWTPLSIPQADPLASRVPEPTWLLDYQRRQRGFATNLETLGWRRVEARTTVHSPEPRDVYLNVGGKLQSVWLNGESVYERKEWGMTEHAGRDRVPVRLKAGENQILIKSGSSFFVSLTPTRDW